MKYFKDILIGLKPFRSALWLAAFMLFVWWLFVGKDYAFMHVRGVSMEPTLDNKEWFVTQRTGSLGKEWKPEMFDVIVVRESGELLCKRIIGLPGDTIEIKGGYIYLNGLRVKDVYGRGRISVQLVDENDKDLHYWGTNKKAIKYVDAAPIIVPNGSLWVIGDNRTVSWYGLVDEKEILGRVII